MLRCPCPRSALSATFLPIAACLLLPVPAGATGPAPSAGRGLTVVVHGTQRGGLVHWALYASAEQYDGEDKIRGGGAEATGDATVIDVGPLAPGRYSLVCFLDVDRDDEFDTNFIGMPTEPFGFSQDPRKRFGKPDFDATAFEVGRGRLQIEVTLVQL